MPNLGASGLGTRDSGLGTRESGLGTRDSGLGTRDRQFAKRVSAPKARHGPLILVRAGSRRRLWIRRRWLLRVEERQIGAQVPVHAQVIRDTDSDGDPYFRVRLSIAGDGDLDLWEGHDGTQAEAELSRLLRAWGQAANRPSSAPTRLPG